MCQRAEHALSLKDCPVDLTNKNQFNFFIVAFCHVHIRSHFELFADCVE